MKLVLQIAAGVILGGVILWLMRLVFGIGLLGALLGSVGDRVPSLTLPHLNSPPKPPASFDSGWVDQLPNFKHAPPALPQAQQITSGRIVNKEKAPLAAAQFRKVWVPGRPLEECLGQSKELNPEVLRCQKGYYVQEPVTR